AFDKVYDGNDKANVDINNLDLTYETGKDLIQSDVNAGKVALAIDGDTRYNAKTVADASYITLKFAITGDGKDNYTLVDPATPKTITG
ncbi:hypothetical protein, partial [Ralstonia pseudosolanacearum]|uniref:hypothetical protein n=1 Tax=Ralstonia pseudosolanacearum TaxID=1310165 RepID=UPI003CF47CE6